MKFSTVEIIPDVRNPDKLKIIFRDIDGDRVNENLGPNSLGFYHYPRNMGKDKAFEALRAHLVAKHAEHIAKIENSIDKLKALNMPEIGKEKP